MYKQGRVHECSKIPEFDRNAIGASTHTARIFGYDERLAQLEDSTGRQDGVRSSHGSVPSMSDGQGH